jgi:hypothetical protein
MAAGTARQPGAYLSHVFRVLNVGKFFTVCSILPKILTILPTAVGRGVELWSSAL